MHAKSLQSCLTLWDPLDCNPPGSSVHGISQARILEWVAISFSRAIFMTQGSNPCLLCLLHWQVDSLPPAPPRKPLKHKASSVLTHRRQEAHGHPEERAHFSMGTRWWRRGHPKWRPCFQRSAWLKGTGVYVHSASDHEGLCHTYTNIRTGLTTHPSIIR